MVNLVGNACKFTTEGEVVVYVAPVEPEGVKKQSRKRERETRDKMLLEFSVSDTGCGIDPNDLGLLFQAFTKVFILLL